jgi:hypothetical protein
MVVPRLEDAASRIRLHRHEASVEDLLTGSPPLVRLRMTPVSGPLDEAGPARTATLEIRLGEPFNGTVAMVREIDSEGGAWRDEERMPIETLSAAALRGLVIDFVDLGLQAP